MVRQEIGIQSYDPKLAVKAAENIFASRKHLGDRVLSLTERVLDLLFPKDGIDRPQYIGGGIYYFWIPPFH